MVKCPKCKSELDHLKIDRLTHIYQSVSLVNNELSYGSFDDASASVDEKEEFYCPVCGKTITDNEEDAKKFLKGEYIKVKHKR